MQYDAGAFNKNALPPHLNSVRSPWDYYSIEALLPSVSRGTPDPLKISSVSLSFSFATTTPVFDRSQ